MRIASWNVNHRVGKTRFRSEAAEAAIALDADLLLFNEFFPQQHESAFTATLAKAGWIHHLWSPSVPERANRVFAAARLPIEPDPTPLGSFDQQLPSNTLPLRLSESGLRVLALRVPAYAGATRSYTARSWEWLEDTARAWADSPAVIVGDLNANPEQRRGGGAAFARILQNGWAVANSVTEPSYFSPRGHTSTLDHLLHTRHLAVTSAQFVSRTATHVLAGAEGALSDHAALVAELHV